MWPVCHWPLTCCMLMVSAPSASVNGFTAAAGLTNVAEPKVGRTGANQSALSVLELLTPTEGALNSSSKTRLRRLRSAWDPAYCSVQSPDMVELAMHLPLY